MGHESAFSIPAGRKIAQTLIAYVEDQPGTLNRIVSLFRRRGFNIESLTVGRTERDGVSRITVVVRADDDTAHRLEANSTSCQRPLGRGRDPHALGHPEMASSRSGPLPIDARSCCSWCRRFARGWWTWGRSP